MDLTIDQEIVPEIRNQPRHAPYGSEVAGLRICGLMVHTPDLVLNRSSSSSVNARSGWKFMPMTKTLASSIRHPCSPVQHRVIAYGPSWCDSASGIASTRHYFSVSLAVRPDPNTHAVIRIDDLKFRVTIQMPNHRHSSAANVGRVRWVEEAVR